ncbi:MAG TPA: hypothetical protein VHU80_22085 [Polyangiaceae bacterium]|jgi:hypothetical protein|nr:hypothetical protein [Polyangiaceae bacterium]
MAAASDVEAYLRRLDRTFQKVGDDTFLVGLGPGQPPAVVRLSPPVLVARVDVAEAPKNAPALEVKLYRRLLELNATDLVYVAFGIDHDRIVLDAALELSTLDLNELDGVLANLDLAIAEQVPHLHELVKNG